MRTASLGLTLALLGAFAAGPAEKASGPLSPRRELATFSVPEGFRVELVACEPAVVDPVAMAFDERGRIFVVEMRGYPNAGVATGFVTSGRIKLLEDADGDGFYEKSTVYADKLRFPTGVLPWRGGLLVANAPELIYLQDTKGTGKADRRRTLYTGFNLANIQQLVNSLQWGLDNWVHACVGGDGGTISSAERRGLPAVTLRGRGVRFHPEVPGSLEPTSCGGQYGLAADDWGRWFTATNSQHLRHIVLPDHYLRRNPHLAVGVVTLDIPDHGAACKVFRKSPFEAWRVERTTRRAKGPDARRFPATELVPGGYITSACSPAVYTADLFPAAYRGSVFVCDPANNLIHRDVLVPHGATFVARRGDAGREFLASTDNWFRPVHLTVGPDGALYVLDFYREVIETPLSLPDDIKKRLNLESRGRGRIWRVTVAGAKRPRRPALHKASTRELVRHLASPNSWWRLTAQRLLVERQDRAAVRPLGELASSAKRSPGRAHALRTLHGLRALKDEQILDALKDPEPGVREQALALADERLKGSKALRRAVAAMADDPSPRVRFQLAFTLGQADSPELVRALARLARRGDNDTWTQTALLSSAGRAAPALLEELARDREFADSAGRLALLKRLAALVGARGGDAELARALDLLGKSEGGITALQVALLDGLGQGLQDSGRPLSALWERPPEALKGPVARAKVLFERAAEVARDGKRPAGERAEAVRLLGRGPFGPLKSVAARLLRPSAPPEVQMAAIGALSAQARPEVAGLLLEGWAGFSPGVRREAAEALFARPERLRELLSALERKEVLANQLEPARLEQLRRHRDPEVRRRARKVLAGQSAPDRRKVIVSYRAALGMTADRARGKGVFKKNCTTCHRLEGEGFEVGPDLLSALRNKTGEQLLTDILDPSREVDSRYLNYVVTTRRGRVLTGILASESASSVTLRRGEKAEDTILRTQIESIEATGKSLMPDGLEAQLTKQDVADLIAYLRAVAVPK
jgi:putative membrane-bound dehydrogenase-like protein